ncbi:MAG: hypothetical protein ACFFCS_22555, partial [Candidatus Hodarchaeota archaeon]
MRKFEQPRIHQVVFLLVTHDFIFNSPNLVKYYNICKPLLEVAHDFESFEGGKENYRKTSRELARMVREELVIFSKNYKMHGRIIAGELYQFLISMNFKKKIPKTNSLSMKNFDRYFSEFLLKKGLGEEIPHEDLKVY